MFAKKMTQTGYVKFATRLNQERRDAANRNIRKYNLQLETSKDPDDIDWFNARIKSNTKMLERCNDLQKTLIMEG